MTFFASAGMSFLLSISCLTYPCVPGEAENAVFGGSKFLRFCSCVPGEVLVIKELCKQRIA